MNDCYTPNHENNRLLSGLFQALYRKIGVIVMVSISAALAAWLLTATLITPKYEASVNMIVDTRSETSDNITNDNISSAKNLVSAYAIIIKSNVVLDQINRYLQLNMSQEEWNEKITIEAVNNTQIMKIAVLDPKPSRAEAIATAIVQIAPPILTETVKAGSCEAISMVTVSDQPVYPNTVRTSVLAGLLGLVVSVALVILAEVLNDRIVDDVDIEQRLNLQVLGIVKEAKTASGRKGLPNEILLKDMPFDYEESFRTLRTNIEFVSATHGAKVLMVTSALMCEGKSNVAANLAYSMAKNGKKVILVECDMRRPVFCQNFHMDSTSAGLSDYLVGNVAAPVCVQTEVCEGVSMIHAGSIPPNPAELLGMTRMKQLVDTLRGKYDYVILDTPPVTQVADAAILGEVADGAVLAVRSRYAQGRTVQLAKQQLENVGVRIFGAILTRYNVKQLGKYAGYEYHYYKYEQTGKK